MRRPVIITAPPLTPEDTGRLYGLSKRRMKEISDMIEKSLAKRSYAHLYYGSSSANKNGARKPGLQAQGLKANVRGQAKRKAKSNAGARRKSSHRNAKASR